MRTNRFRTYLQPIAGGAVLACFATAFNACSTDGGGETTLSIVTCSADLASIETTIFRPSCATTGCHVGATPAADLDLVGDTEALLVGVPSALCQGAVRVVPGVPSDSLLYQKIAGSTACGAPMPIGSKLSPEQRICIEDWILSLNVVPPSDAGADAPDASCETCGGAVCVNLQTDPLHCGACGAPCTAGAACSAGTCACASGQTSCASQCVNTKLDPNNCGSCGTACPVGSACIDGACQCPNGQDVCGTACVDKSSDPMNCGACGNTCGAGKVCALGVCAMNCGALTKCGASCVDIQTSATDCGACGNTCAPGQACSSGACACGLGSVSYSGAVQPILTMRCATNGCHTGVMPAQGLKLTAAASYSNLVNVAASECADGRKRVLPGQPATSYLIDKLMGVDLCFGTMMPKQAMIPAAELQVISDWICQGSSRITDADRFPFKSEEFAVSSRHGGLAEERKV